VVDRRKNLDALVLAGQQLQAIGVAFVPQFQNGGLCPAALDVGKDFVADLELQRLGRALLEAVLEKRTIEVAPEKTEALSEAIHSERASDDTHPMKMNLQVRFSLAAHLSSRNEPPKSMCTP
jgi:hypothetical protein